MCGDAVTGAPAGVTIQWKKCSDFAIDGWAATNSYCGLSLSGVPPCSRWSLGPGECQDITIHASTVTDENAAFCGASSDCISDLACDTDYIFRIFAHNDPNPGGLAKSDFSCTDQNGLTCSPNVNNCLVCRTAACTGGGDCTFTWGYWKTHGPAGCNPSGGANVWPAGNQTVGGLSLDHAALCAILQDNPKACGKGGGANAVLILEHQLIAAELNLASGAIDCGFVHTAISDANALLSGNEYACVGAPSALGQQMLAVKDVLAAYNDDQCSCPVEMSKGKAIIVAPTEVQQSSWGKLKILYR
ncbi:MAG TPA: hypothetical protein VGK93_03795 [Candidatus Eisenbacteria bacterium]